MFTGWYPHVHGHRTLDYLIKPWEPNLLRMLREAGYHVAWAGLRGDTFAPGVTQASTDRWGFVERPKVIYTPSPYPEDHRFARVFYHGRREAVYDFDEAAVCTAESWLGEGLPEPWVLFVGLVFPHPPFEVEEPFYSLHDRAQVPEPAPPPRDPKPRFMDAIRNAYGTERLTPDDWAELIATYYGMVSRVDHQLGRVLDAVERSGSADRTYTFYFTDHGEYLGDYGLVEKWPSGLHECLLRNPLIVAGPSSRSGNVCNGLVEMVDLLPTLAELAEVEVRHTHFGRSLVPLLADGSLAHRDAAFSEGGFSLEEEPLLESSPFPYDKKSALQHTALRPCERPARARQPGREARARGSRAGAQGSRARLAARHSGRDPLGRGPALRAGALEEGRRAGRSARGLTPALDIARALRGNVEATPGCERRSDACSPP
jgi:arylsulfatase A-like enzyme